MMSKSSAREGGQPVGRPRNEDVRFLLREFCLEVLGEGDLKVGDLFPGAEPIRKRFEKKYNVGFNDDVFADVLAQLADSEHSVLAERPMEDAKRKRYEIKRMPVGLDASVAGTVEAGLGFSHTCLDAIEEVGPGNIYSIKYKENWFDSVDRSSQLFNRFQDILDPSTPKGKTREFQIILQNTNFVAPKIQRISGMSSTFLDHCKSIADRIAGDAGFELSKSGPSRALSPKLVGLREALFDRVVEVALKLYDDYHLVERLTAKVYDMNLRASGTAKVSFSVRAYRSWQSFPCLILNDNIAILGFYPSDRWANQVPALCVRGEGKVQGPLLHMARSDFAASWDQGVVVFDGEGVAPEMVGNMNAFTSTFGEAQLRAANIDRGRIREHIANLLDNFAEPLGRPRTDKTESL